jgi:Ca2+:H+ antiporter
VMLLLTMAVSVVTFTSGGRTNVMQGLVHLILFLVFVLLMVEG